MPLSDEQLRHIEAQCRAMSITRMIDYGMPRETAEAAHHRVRGGEAWDLMLEQIAGEFEAKAGTETDTTKAREAWHAAAASLIFAQMAFNTDNDRKRELYRRMNGCFAHFAALSPFSASRIEVPYKGGRLYGWHFRAAESAGSVIAFGGMSGWSTAYRSAADALCEHGLDCYLVDGPGQGDSRLEGGLHADADVAAGFSRFIDLVLDRSPRHRIGMWGNSYGGLLAALTAVRDPRVAACCVNGGPPRTEVPPFRTAQEQIAAMFGRASADELADILPALAFAGHRAPLSCAVLVLEGGADMLVPPGAQRSFLEGNHHPLSRLQTWPDGEHTIYNHAAERNALAADWFVAALAGPAGRETS